MKIDLSNLNQIYNENCIDTMKRMDNNFIDLVVTSPPYDNLRTYNGYSFEFENVANELYRVIKSGGVIVWIVGDQVIKGDETGTSFRQALYFKSIGFKLFDTMIYSKGNSGISGMNTCYTQDFEYMFVFSKNEYPKTINLIRDRKNKRFDGFCQSKNKKNVRISTRRKSNGEITDKYRDISIKEFGRRSNIWTYRYDHDELLPYSGKHPAVFPYNLARDHIISWSNECDVIYDPFMGSGTTAIACKLEKRNYIGSEISKEYCDLIEKRLRDIGTPIF